jgi:hypothetical protein
LKALADTIRKVMEDSRAGQGEGPGHNTQQGHATIADSGMQSNATAA